MSTKDLIERLNRTQTTTRRSAEKDGETEGRSRVSTRVGARVIRRRRKTEAEEAPTPTGLPTAAKEQPVAAKEEPKAAEATPADAAPAEAAEAAPAKKKTKKKATKKKVEAKDAIPEGTESAADAETPANNLWAVGNPRPELVVAPHIDVGATCHRRKSSASRAIAMRQ